MTNIHICDIPIAKIKELVECLGAYGEEYSLKIYSGAVFLASESNSCERFLWCKDLNMWMKLTGTEVTEVRKRYPI